MAVSISRKNVSTPPNLDALGLADDQKKVIKPRAAVAWFLSDMAETSGYAVATWTNGRMLSMYAEHRPLLTAPDPWYYAGIVALEACKIMDLFEKREADELMREVIRQMDGVVGRFNTDCSDLAILLMGRLGMGSLIMHRKVPDNLLAKIMLILLGSPSAAAPNMPDPNAHKQLKAALKTGAPVWWRMFRRYNRLKMPGMDEAAKPVLTQSILKVEPVKLGNTKTKQQAASLKDILNDAMDENVEAPADSGPLLLENPMVEGSAATTDSDIKDIGDAGPLVLDDDLRISPPASKTLQ